MNRQCAWCRAELAPHIEGAKTSHGICPECMAKQLCVKVTLSREPAEPDHLHTQQRLDCSWGEFEKQTQRRLFE